MYKIIPHGEVLIFHQDCLTFEGWVLSTFFTLKFLMQYEYFFSILGESTW